MKSIKSNRFKKPSKKILISVSSILLLLVGGVFIYNSRINDLEQQSIGQLVNSYEIEKAPDEELESETEDVAVAEPETPPAQTTPKPQPEPAASSGWPVVYTLEQANSLTVVVNKKHKLPSNYAPTLVSVAGGQMRPEAADPMQKLLDAASAAGASMNIISSYRSYNTQVSTYQYWVDTQGQVQADRESARPGHSEHQTGLTADLGNPDGTCRLLACFGSGAAGSWLANNAHKYGFIIRYPQNKESLTGYIYEPWHIRYLGTDIATAVYNSGLTLDQYYGIEAGNY